jgi:hypothetical protein
MPAKHDNASRRVPLSALFGSRWQRTTDLTLRVGYQAWMPARSRALSVAPEFPLRQHTPHKLPLPRLARHCVPLDSEDQDGFESPPRFDAAGQRDYVGRMRLTAMERRSSALPPLTPGWYHHNWRTRSAAEAVPLDRGDSLTLRSLPHVMLRSQRVGQLLMLHERRRVGLRTPAPRVA